MSATNKVALVTGASSGIGQAIAYGLAKAGNGIAVNYNTNAGGARETADKINSAGGKAITIQADVGDIAAVEKMFEKVNNELGAVDILVNNAGIVRDNLLLRMSYEEFDAVINTNLKGTFYCCKMAIRSMVKKRWGRIINISSIVGMLGNPGQSNYAASKGAINAFTKSLARELGSRNITVNAIAPGYVETKTSSVSTEATLNTVFALSAIKRFGQPKEVAPVAVMLASEEASFITGAIIRVDGGL